jgi:uncharacterized protein
VRPEKYDRLLDVIRAYGSGLVALSGGADSSLLARAAHEALGTRALAVTGASASIPPRELEGARAVADTIGIAYRVIETHELDDPNYVANPTNRCYFCKNELYGRLTELARAEGYAAVFSGDNVDDLKDHRPGRQAALEHLVRFPLQEAGLTKDEIRALSHELGLPTWDKPASPCLSSRVAYGEPIDPQWLARIDEAECFLRELGFATVRVRHHRDVARIEVGGAELVRLLEHRELVTARLRALGWAFVAMDLTGFRSGSLNRVLPTVKG